MAEHKFSIVLTNKQWQQLRPRVKQLQKNKKLTYSAQGYATDKVLIVCDCIDCKTERIIDNNIESILGYVYA